MMIQSLQYSTFSHFLLYGRAVGSVPKAIYNLYIGLCVFSTSCIRSGESIIILSDKQYGLASTTVKNYWLIAFK